MSFSMSPVMWPPFRGHPPSRTPSSPWNYGPIADGGLRYFGVFYTPLFGQTNQVGIRKTEFRLMSFGQQECGGESKKSFGRRKAK